MQNFWPFQNGVQLKGSALLLKTGSYDHELKELQTPSASQLTQESLVDVRGVDYRQLLPIVRILSKRARLEQSVSNAQEVTIWS